MRAELIPEDTFTLQVGCLQVQGMRVVSKWNGLMELRNSKNEVLIVSAPERSALGSTFDTLFGDVFRSAADTKAAGSVIVMGSPDLIARLTAANAAKPAPPSSPEA